MFFEFMSMKGKLRKEEEYMHTPIEDLMDQVILEANGAPAKQVAKVAQRRSAITSKVSIVIDREDNSPVYDDPGHPPMFMFIPNIVEVKKLILRATLLQFQDDNLVNI